jgi:hypothetical protein
MGAAGGPHPHMRRGLEEVLASGELERRKIAVFMRLVWR